MTDTKLETAEEFARRVCRSLPPCDLNSIMARNALVEAIRARDAAVKAEALEEAASVCDLFAATERDVPPDARLGDGSSATALWLARELRLVAGAK